MSSILSVPSTSTPVVYELYSKTTLLARVYPGEGRLVIGSGSSADIRITGPGVEPRHAMVELGQDGLLKVRPISGMLKLNDSPASEVQTIGESTTISFGDVRLWVSRTTIDRLEPEPEAARVDHERHLDHQTKALPSLPDLEGFVLRVPGYGEIPLRMGQQVTIGRDEDCDIRLQNSVVSRKHAMIVATPKGLLVRDLASLNGTYVGETAVKNAYVRRDSDLRIGTVPVTVSLAFLRKIEADLVPAVGVTNLETSDPPMAVAALARRADGSVERHVIVDGPDLRERALRILDRHTEEPAEDVERAEANRRDLFRRAYEIVQRYSNEVARGERRAERQRALR